VNVDLHCHSTASDGALAPAVLVARAFEKGVRVLSLTDHDTLEGLDEARGAAQALGMQLVNGVELSCTWGGATIHVLGYGFDQKAPPLVEAVAQLRDGRWLRSEEISRKLGLKGMSNALDGARAIQQELGDSGNAPARPHSPIGWCAKGLSGTAPKPFANGWAPASWATSSSTGRPWTTPSRPCGPPGPGSAWHIPGITISPAASVAS
jgi:hypothetical protein